MKTIDFIKKAIIVHGDKYDYSKSIYTVSTEKITIICNIHGEFRQIATSHINNKYNCPSCAKITQNIKFKKTHNSRKENFDHIVPPIGSKIIPLSKGLYCIVDADDYDDLMKFNWYASKLSNSEIVYAKTRLKGKMHRYLMSVNDPSIMVDHRNHNTLDNRKSNLRLCNGAQNNMNRILIPNTSSIYKGVTFLKRRNKWKACITMNNVRYYIGEFINEIDAAKAYDMKAKELFGKFAYLNFKIINKAKNAG